MSEEMSAADSTDSSVVVVLERFAEEGWTANHTTRPDGMMKCGRCSQESPADAVTAGAVHRVEGTSDPDDMQMVAGIECPKCGGRGALVIAYGPTAPEQDAAFLVDLDLDDAPDPLAADPHTE